MTRGRSLVKVTLHCLDRIVERSSLFACKSIPFIFLPSFSSIEKRVSETSRSIQSLIWPQVVTKNQRRQDWPPSSSTWILTLVSSSVLLIIVIHSSFFFHFSRVSLTKQLSSQAKISSRSSLVFVQKFFQSKNQKVPGLFSQRLSGLHFHSPFLSTQLKLLAFLSKSLVKGITSRNEGKWRRGLLIFIALPWEAKKESDQEIRASKERDLSMPSFTAAFFVHARNYTGNVDERTLVENHSEKISFALGHFLSTFSLLVKGKRTQTECFWGRHVSKKKVWKTAKGDVNKLSLSCEERKDSKTREKKEVRGRRTCQ